MATQQLSRPAGSTQWVRNKQGNIGQLGTTQIRRTAPTGQITPTVAAETTPRVTRTAAQQAAGVAKRKAGKKRARKIVKRPQRVNVMGVKARGSKKTTPRKRGSTTGVKKATRTARDFEGHLG